MLAPSLRIAVLGPARFGIGEPFAGGLEAHTVTTARALIGGGHDVTVFAGPSTATTPSDLDVVPIVDDLGDFSTCTRLDTTVSARVRAAMEYGYERVLRFIDADGAYDVVHNNSLHHAPVDLDGETRTPVVHVLHCPPFDELMDAHQRRATRLPDPTENVIAVSSSLARQWDGVAGRTVWNGIDTQVWRPAVDVSPRDERCIWAGRIVSEKAPHLAIDAARRTGRPIVLAGPIQEPRYFDDEIVPRLAPDAVYLGHLDNAALVSLFSTSRVGVVTPCWEEPFGLVVAEMLACGMPVAAFARGALPDIVVSSVGALSRPDDIDDLADCIERASGLSSSECRAHAVTHLSTDRMARAYERCYRHAIDDVPQALAM